MIGWQNLSALWALPLLAIPVIVHLLRVHRADKVLFPSLRFVQSSRTAAVRLRLPSDVMLMILRMAIVAMVVAALAGPVVVTQRRLNAWNARTARAVIVDVSARMDRSTTAGTLAMQAKDAAGAEQKTATYARVFDVRDLEAGFERAAAWLATAPPARREIVVLSDFQRGTIAGDTVARLPASVGVRLVPIGTPLSYVAIGGLETLDAPGVAQRHQNIELTPDSTRVTTSPSEIAPTGGIRFVNALPAEQTSLLRAIAIAGTPAGSTDQPIAFVFDADKDQTATTGLSPIRERWMLQTLLRLNQHLSIPLTGNNTTDWGGVRPRSDPSGVRVGTNGRELMVGVAAPASSFAAAAVVRAVLVARRSTDDFAELEIARTSEAVLSALNRPAAPVGRDAWRAAESTDARWCWLLALLLLALEQWLRARPEVRRSQEVTRAAA